MRSTEASSAGARGEGEEEVGGRGSRVVQNHALHRGKLGGGETDADRDWLLIQPGSEAQLVIERSARKAAARATAGRLAGAGEPRIQLATDHVATPVIEVIVEWNDE